MLFQAKYFKTLQLNENKNKIFKTFIRFIVIIFVLDQCCTTLFDTSHNCFLCYNIDYQLCYLSYLWLIINLLKTILTIYPRFNNLSHSLNRALSCLSCHLPVDLFVDQLLYGKVA